MTDGIMAHIPLRRVVAVESVVFPGEKKPAGVWHKRRSADSLQLPVLRGKFAPGSVRHPNTLPEVFDRARSGFHGLQAALNFDPSACPHSVGDPGQVNPLSVVVPVRLAAPAGHSSDEPILVQHTLSATAYARLIAPLRSEPREPEGSTSSFDGGGDLEGTSRRRYRGHRGGAVPDTVSAADRSLASATQRLDLTCITGFCAWLVVYMQVRVCVVGPPPHGQQTHHAGVCPLKAHALTLFLLCVCVRARGRRTPSGSTLRAPESAETSARSCSHADRARCTRSEQRCVPRPTMCCSWVTRTCVHPGTNAAVAIASRPSRCVHLCLLCVRARLLLHACLCC